MSTSKSSNPRVPLRGIERYGIMLEDVTIKVGQSVLVSGEVGTLMHFLPTALMNIFNRHPRMRLAVLKDEPFMGEIRPHITLDTITENHLLRVREFGDSKEDAEAWETWKEFIPQECELPIVDRSKDYLFYLCVWVNKTAGLARLMLFSDHIVSDGESGLVVVNDILEQVTLLSKETPEEIKEFPLRPSLYDMWFSPSWWIKPVAKTLLFLFAKPTFKYVAETFKPVLAPGPDQQDFATPIKQNRTHGLFAEGDPACMRKTMAKCKEEKVSFAGALIPVIVLAFFHARRKQKDFDASENDDILKMAAEVNYNMRKRVANPAEETQVGMYVTIAALLFLREGVDMRTTKFWDLARRARQEIVTQGEQMLQMGLPFFMLDRNFNSESVESFLGDTRVPGSVYGDVNISSIGRYPFSTVHELANNGELRVENTHTFSTVPFIASSATMWVETVNAFNYSIGHKCEENVGKELFKAYVAVCENAGSIDHGETMLEVLQRLEAAGEL